MAEADYPKSKEDLMSEIEREWEVLMQFISRLTPQQMSALDSGGWAPKDNLAHLTVWMELMRRKALGGEPVYIPMDDVDPEKFMGLDEDGENAVIFEHNRHRPAEEILTELKKIYDETVKKLKGTSYADLLKPLRADDPNQRPVISSVIGNTSAHIAEHRASMERNLKANA
jgi:hypothetical protein